MGSKTNSQFRFVPGELAVKCRSLIESFHGMYGYVGLPDMLWLSDARDIITCHEDLTQLFKKASRSRGAKRANDTFLMIATAIVAIEVLARDFAGWGKRFPSAKREANKLFGDFSQHQRVWLIDLYLYPPLAFAANLPTHFNHPTQRQPRRGELQSSHPKRKHADQCERHGRMSRIRPRRDRPERFWVPRKAETRSGMRNYKAQRHPE